jgi:hypothetical protein
MKAFILITTTLELELLRALLFAYFSSVRSVHKKPFENSIAGRCGFNSDQCLFFSQCNAIKQNSKSTFLSYFYFL